MKRLTIPLVILSTAFLLSGCIGLSMGGGSKTESHNPTLGQQLIDLKTARDTGAITDAEYQAQKSKLLAK
jgi:PBP1b-binding outer membrane lipoprotein LpoB